MYIFVMVCDNGEATILGIHIIFNAASPRLCLNDENVLWIPQKDKQKYPLMMSI